jgi:hypothetical protein
VLSGDTLRFFDFDFCSFHPAAFDAVCLIRPYFPTCNDVAELPREIAERAIAAYLQCVEVEEAEVLNASVVGTLSNAGNGLAKTLAGDQMLGPSSSRQMLLWRLRSTSESCREAGRLTSLATLLADLAGVLAERWAEVEPMPLYPAFARS